MMKYLITILFLFSTTGCFGDQQLDENDIQTMSVYPPTPTATEPSINLLETDDIPTSTISILTPPSPTLPEGRMVFTTIPNDSLWVMDLPSLDRQLLYHQAGGMIQTPRLLPDGINFTFLWDIGNKRGDFDLYQGDIFGSTPKKIAEDIGGVISPDRKSMVFFRELNDDLYPSFDLFKYDFSSGPITQLTSDGIFKGQITWSPDSTKIAYVVGLDLTGDLAVIGNDGSNILSLPDVNIEYGLGLAWSMNGELIVAPYQNGENINLKEVNIRTLEIIEIKSPATESNCFFPFFYSMDNKVVSSCTVAGSRNLFILDIVSGEYIQLTGFHNNSTPSTMINGLSTFDGDQILFLYRPGNQLDDTMDLYLVSIKNHTVFELTSDLDINDYDWILDDTLLKN